jgi:catechol 2,3-dioxygenase-like lactoylglutathione lyase family enzyme
MTMHAIQINFLVQVLFSLALAFSVQSQDWPTYRHDNSRTGAQPVASDLSDPTKVRSLSVKWSFPDAPAASASPFVDTFGRPKQQHFAYLGPNGAIWDALYDDNGNQWHLAQLNCGAASACGSTNSDAMTDGPPAVAGPFVDTFGPNQQHFAYLAQNGSIWDAFYDNNGNHWWQQQINCGSASACGSKNSDAMTDGPPAVGGLFVDTFGSSQQHFAYLGPNGAIWDAFYDNNGNHWHLQQINCGPASACDSKNSDAMTDGPPAVGGLFVDTFGSNQQHFAYLGPNGAIWDAFYDNNGNHWHLAQLNCGPASACESKNSDAMTDGPPAVGGLFVDTFGSNQQHFAYLGPNGTIWDAFYDNNGNHWWVAQLNCNAASACDSKNSDAMTDGPPAVGGLFVDTFGSNQQHFAYLAQNGAIWDAFYDNNGNHWWRQQINCGAASACGSTNSDAMTDGPPAVAGPFVDTFGSQQHFAYLAQNGAIWDAFYGNNGNHLQLINEFGVAAPSLDAFKGSAIVVGGTVFIGNTNGYFYALDTTTGAQKWRYPPAGQSALLGGDKQWRYGIQSSAAYWDRAPNGAVVFGAQDPSLGPNGPQGSFGSARLFVLDAKFGTPILKSDLVAEINGDTVGSDTEIHPRTHSTGRSSI